MDSKQHFSLEDLFSSSVEPSDFPEGKELVLPSGEVSGTYETVVPDLSNLPKEHLEAHVAVLTAKLTSQEILLNVVIDLCMSKGLFDEQEFGEHIAKYTKVFWENPPKE